MDEVRDDMRRVRLFLGWTVTGVVLLIIALLIARFVSDNWWMASWTIGVMSIITAGKGAFEFGRGAPRN